MITLVDNTVLSNFALVGRMDLLQLVLGTSAGTTAEVSREFETGVSLNRLPPTDVGWLRRWTVSSEESGLYERLRQHLNAGEASCLAIAAHRQGPGLRGGITSLSNPCDAPRHAHRLSHSSSTSRA